MSEKNTNRWLVGVVVALLSLVGTSSIAMGALFNRVDGLEKREAVYVQDHDTIIKMNTRQELMIQKLDQMNKKLDDLATEDDK